MPCRIGTHKAVKLIEIGDAEALDTLPALREVLEETSICGLGQAALNPEVWAQTRTEDIRLQAHDLGHIEDIARRHEKAEARRRPGAAPPDENHIETVRESYEKLASQSKEKTPDEGEGDAAPVPDETSEKRP